MKKATSISYSTIQFVLPVTAVVEVITLLDLNTAPHLHVANDLSLREVAEPSANLSLDDLTVLGMSVIVLVDGMTEEEEDTVDMVVFAHPSQIVSAVPVALGVTGLGGMMIMNTLLSHYQIHRTPNLTQMSSQ
jgi:hypothetical protein